MEVVWLKESCSLNVNFLKSTANPDCCGALQVYRLIEPASSNTFARVQLFQAHLYLFSALPKGSAPPMPLALFKACKEVGPALYMLFLPTNAYLFCHLTHLSSSNAVHCELR